jgi:tRNA threonylcarbamoyladenosine biosynthesis protein TsaE
LTELSLQLSDEPATMALGEALAAAAQPPLVIYLSGELGAGKTTLVRALARAHGYPGPVRSPSYTLLETYPLLPGLTLVHLDLYRLTDPEELELLGLREELGSDVLCLVEWPERGVGHLPAADLDISLQHSGSGRRALLAAASAAGRRCLTAISLPRAQ